MSGMLDYVAEAISLLRDQADAVHESHNAPGETSFEGEPEAEAAYAELERVANGLETEIAARLRGDGEQGDVIEAECTGCGSKMFAWPQHRYSSKCLGCVADDEQGQAVAWASPEGMERLRTQDDSATVVPEAFRDSRHTIPLYDRPQPVAGDAVRALPAKWRASIDAASPHRPQDLRPIRFVLDLEAALSTQPAPSEQVAASAAVPDEAIRQALVTHVPRVTDKKVETIIRYIRKLAAEPVAPERGVRP